MDNLDKFDFRNEKSSPDSSPKNRDEFSPFEGGQGDGRYKDLESDAPKQKHIQNRIDQFIKRSSFHFHTNVNQEVRPQNRNQEDPNNSNRTKTKSNQKGAHYVKQ